MAALRNYVSELKYHLSHGANPKTKGCCGYAPIEHIEQNFKILIDEYAKIGLSFNPEKTEVVISNW
jgi:hypothetical protein